MLVGITGTIGAGKGTIVSYLEKKGFRHVSVSGFLAEEALRRGKDATRIVRREIANEYRAHGANALIEEVLADVNPKKDSLVVESLHTVSEVEYIRHVGGVVISLDAPLAVRWARIQERGDEKDSASFEAFFAEEKRQMSSENANENNLIAAMEAADFHLENAGTERELFAAVDAILAGLI